MSVEKTFNEFIENANKFGKHYEDTSVFTEEKASDFVKEYEDLLNKLNQSFNTFKSSVNKIETLVENDISVLRKGEKFISRPYVKSIF